MAAGFYSAKWVDELANFGKKFYARYDRRHDISLVGIYKINDRITVSATWVYGTGNAVTMPLSAYQAIEHLYTNRNPVAPDKYSYSAFGRVVNDFSKKNNCRMGAYHRLDAGIQFHKQKKHWERTWEFSVYNAYNRMNPFFYYTEHVIRDGKPYGVLKQVNLFPVIPSFTYNIKF